MSKCHLLKLTRKCKTRHFGKIYLFWNFCDVFVKIRCVSFFFKIICRIVECKSLMAVKKDYKISLVVMVITRKYYIYYSWPPATRNKCNIFLVMTITTCDILRSFFTAIKDSPNICTYILIHYSWGILPT